MLEAALYGIQWVKVSLWTRIDPTSLYFISKLSIIWFCDIVIVYLLKSASILKFIFFKKLGKTWRKMRTLCERHLHSVLLSILRLWLMKSAFFFLLKYSWFQMFLQVLLYSKVTTEQINSSSYWLNWIQESKNYYDTTSKITISFWNSLIWEGKKIGLVLFIFFQPKTWREQDANLLYVFLGRKVRNRNQKFLFYHERI